MRLVADANVLLSAVIGGQAKAVREHPRVKAVATTESTFREVQEYGGFLARKKGLDAELILLAVAALPVILVPRKEYQKALPRAGGRLGTGIQTTLISSH